jgi:hypothetical protein
MFNHGYIAQKKGEGNIKTRGTNKSVYRTSMNQFFVGGMYWHIGMWNQPYDVLFGVGNWGTSMT